MAQDPTYWAAKPINELGPILFTKLDDYYRFLESSGLVRKYKKAYDAYFGFTPSSYFQSSSDVAQGGEQGELSLVRVNEFRNLVKHLLVLTTSQRPALEARASNSDRRSKMQTILANSILEYYLRDKRLERDLKAACELALVLGEGYVHLKWNTSQGAKYGTDPDTQKVIKEGDLEYRSGIGPMEVCRDIHAKNGIYHDWRIVTEWENRYDLMAKYPDLAEQILAIETSTTSNNSSNTLSASPNPDTGDKIAVRYFYHKPTDAVPDGRMSIQLSPEINLFDGPLPVVNLPGGLPLFRITPDEFWGTAFGYTTAWDVLGLAEVNDALHSTIVTNQTTFGVQNVLVPKGHDISYQQLTGGLNLIEYDPKLGKPESLNLTKTPPEVLNYQEVVDKKMTILLGLNDVVKGNPQASLESGSALALVASQALQFNSGLQASYVALLEDVGTATVRFLQTFANTKRVASIAGRANRFMLTEFSGADLDQINGCVVDVSNPLAQSVSGRLQMAENMLKIPGLITHPDKYIEVLETGTLSPLTEGKERVYLTIDEENEMMQSGQKPVVVLTDNHKLHVDEHQYVLETSDARRDPKIVALVTAHIQDHINVMMNTDPRILIMMGQQPLPPPPPPPGNQPPPGSPPPPGGPHGAPPPGMPPHPPMPGPANMPPAPPGARMNGPASPQGMSNPTPGIVDKVANIRHAQMPKNLLTGQKFNPTGPQG